MNILNCKLGNPDGVRVKIETYDEDENSLANVPYVSQSEDPIIVSLPKDHLLFCDICDNIFLDGCSDHPLAIATGNDLLETKFSSPKSEVEGVFSKSGQAIERSTLLGPYPGDFYTRDEYTSKDPKSGRAFELMDSDFKEVIGYLDPGSSYSETSCLPLLKKTPKLHGENVMPIQYKGSIYFRVTKSISPGEELLMESAHDTRATANHSESPQQNFQCTSCGLLFREKVSNEQSAEPRKKIKTKRHLCSYCSDTLGLKGNIYRHIDIVQGKVQNHKCPLCNKTFNERYKVENHVRAIHHKFQDKQPSVGPSLKRQVVSSENGHSDSSMDEIDPLIETEVGDSTNQDRVNGTEMLKDSIKCLEKFFSFDSYISTQKDKCGKDIHRGRAKCMDSSCSKKGRTAPTFSFTTRSRSNLIKHYVNAHKDTVSSFRAAQERINKKTDRRMDKVMTTTPNAFKLHQVQLDGPILQKNDSRTNQETLELCTRWMVDTFMPTRLVDHRSTKDFFRQIAPNFSLPSSRSIEHEIESLSTRTRTSVFKTLLPIEHVATTADTWTVTGNRAFIGMTCNWIGEGLRRMQCILSCKEIKHNNLTGSYLASVINQIHREFGLPLKVTSTTTDNGSNYEPVLTQFGLVHIKKETESELSENESNSIRTVDLYSKLNQTSPESRKKILPEHFRCGVYTINIIATEDVRSVNGWNNDPSEPFSKAAAKAQSTWDLVHQSSTIANSMEDAVGRKLKTFHGSMWNSYYACIKDLMENALSNENNMRALNGLLRDNDCTTFDEMDKKIFSEYLRVLKPVLECLEYLQSETNAYMGAFMPTLELMRVQLECLKSETSLRYSRPLILALLGSQESGLGYYGRFGARVRDPRLLLASALHPHYTLSLVRHFCPDEADDIRQRVLKDLITRVKEYLQLPNVSEQALNGSLTETLDNWNRVVVNTPLSHGVFPSGMFREAFIHLFKMYNTPLHSSSGVEMYFTTSEGDVLRRDSMSDNFEQLVFIKGNRHLLSDHSSGGPY